MPILVTMNRHFLYYIRKKEITLKINQEDYPKALWFREYIMNQCKTKQLITPEIFSQFMSFFNEIDSVEIRKFDSEKINRTKDYFLSGIKRKHYDFQINHRIRSDKYFPDTSKPTFAPKYIEHHYDFLLLIHDVFRIVLKISDVEENDTDEFVRRCYLAIEACLNKNLMKDSEHKFFSHFKRTAIASFICSQSGWKFKRQKSENEELFTPNDWYEMGRHQIELLSISEVRFHPKRKSPNQKND